MTYMTKLLITLVLLFGPVMAANAAVSFEQKNSFAAFQSETEPGTEEGAKKEEEEPEC